MERALRLRLSAASAASISLATLVLGCQPNVSSPEVGSRDTDRRLDSQALRSIPTAYHKQVCGDAAPGQARCHAHVRTAPDGTVQPLAGPTGLNPADLRIAYAVPSGGAGRTVALVDAFDHPNAEADLGVYRAQFGLPACTTANGCFKKVNQSGAASPLPTTDSGWGLEIALDLQMVSAICPACKILLVESSDASLTNLGTAVNTAASLGAFAISNSYGGAESALTTTFDATYFNHPGVLITASSGDNGYGVLFPASSAHVLSVGGTSLVSSGSSRGWAETTWNGAGSGCSAFVAKPSFQTDTGCGRRMVADVSAVADPATGASVYDTFGYSGWIVVGGTSAASPIVAATFAAAGVSNAGNSYPYSNSNAFYDVTSGSNGSCGTPYLCNGQGGYDGPTGLGTPNGAAIAAGCSSGVLGAPAWTSATDGTYDDRVRVAWGTWCGATSYQVFRNTTSSSSGATQIATPGAPPYDDTSASPGAVYYYFVKACNGAGCSDFSPTDSGYRTQGNAAYDATLKTPKCGTAGPFCDSGTLLVGRGPVGPEPNAPNTIANSCADGTSGTFHSSESLDRLQISSLDGSNLAPGKSVRIDATVWVRSTTADRLDLYLSTDTTSLSWSLLTPTSLRPTATGQQILSQIVTLPASGGAQWVLRGNFRNNGSQVICPSGSSNDHDDLVFIIPPPLPGNAAGVSASDGTYTDKVRVSWNASSGATSYQIYRGATGSASGSSQIGTASASPYDDTTTTPGATYYYFVKACNSGGCSDFSAADPGYRAMTAPAGVAATDGVYTDKVQVSWSSATGADSYQIFRNLADSASGSAQIGTVAASPYDDTTATAGTTYYYFVKACNGAVCSVLSASDGGYRAVPPGLDAGLDAAPAVGSVDAGVDAGIDTTPDSSTGAGADSLSCGCAGTGPGGVPITVACGESICGEDYHAWSCSSSGWSGPGQICTGNTDGGTTCQCAGTGPGGAPIAVACGQSICGEDYHAWACSAYGWSGPGQACTGNTDGGTTCQCVGTGPGGAPITVACGQSICGEDYHAWACSASGWSGPGQACTGSTDGGVACQCAGTGPGGTPITVDCGQSICGEDHHTWSCSASGWSGLGQDCTGNADGGAVCQCAGTGPGGAPITVTCGQSVCGEDFHTWACSSSGWSGPGQACTANSDGGPI